MEVVLLAGRLGLDDDGWPLVRSWIGSSSRGIVPRVALPCRGALSWAAIPASSRFPALGTAG